MAGAAEQQGANLGDKLGMLGRRRRQPCQRIVDGAQQSVDAHGARPQHYLLLQRRRQQVLDRLPPIKSMFTRLKI